MAQKLLLSAILIAGLAACGAPAASTSDAPSKAATQIAIPNISAQDASARLHADSGVTVLDIRTPKEFAAGHISGAVLMDYNSKSFAEDVSKLDRSQAYIVHCQSGGRSGRSMQQFKRLGFENVSHMKGGIAEWKKEGLPLTQ